MNDRKDDEDSAIDEADGSDVEDEQPDPADEDDGTPRAIAADVHEFLSRRATLMRAAGIIGKRVPPDQVGDFVNDAVVQAQSAVKLPALGKLQAWFDSICRRVVARHYRKKKRREKHEGQLPEQPVQLDEAGEPIPADAVDPVFDVDPSTDPREADESPRAEGVLFARWMRWAVAGNPTDRETWAMMEEWADGEDDGKTYESIAQSRGMSEAAFKKRAQRLREKYRPRYEKWRHRAVFVLVLFGAFAVVICLYVVLRKDERPNPAAPQSPQPVQSASAGPPELPFEPALPTTAQPQSPPSPKPPLPAPGPKPGDKPPR
ncbi:MAG TPA: hypothetical protein VF765_20525 [Polyangiaceae bacterium]